MARIFLSHSSKDLFEAIPLNGHRDHLEVERLQLAQNYGLLRRNDAKCG